jgi:hypothetical protein
MESFTGTFGMRHSILEAPISKIGLIDFDETLCHRRRDAVPPPEGVVTFTIPGSPQLLLPKLLSTM